MARQKGSGLDALFTKVFANDSVKNTLELMHNEFSVPQRDTANSNHDAQIPTSDVPSDVTSDGTSDVGVRQTERQTSRQTSERNTERNTKRNTIKNSARNTERHTARNTERNTYLHDPVIDLTARQGMVLYYLLQRPDFVAQRHTMGQALNMPLPTIRDCISCLVRDRFISKPVKFVSRSFQGFTYRILDGSQCSRFMALRGEEFRVEIERHTGRHTGRQSDETCDVPYNVTSDVSSDVTSLPISSSSLKDLKTTTTKDFSTDDLMKDPELGYWKEKGVNNRQINIWSDEFQMSTEQVVQSLKYCRFEMVVLNLEEERQISNSLNWFYKVLQRSGLYPKPVGYKSLTEIRAEQVEQAAKEAAEARERQATAEKDLVFQSIMSNPDSEEYRRLLVQVSDFSREMGGQALEVAMREIFSGVKT